MINKAQTAVEFLIILGVVLFFFTTFFVLIQENITEKNRQRESIMVTNLALIVQDEANLAHEATNGYSRNFTLPYNINGKYYDIFIINHDTVYVNMTRNAVSLKIKELIVNQDPIKGVNKIKKENGKVYLN